MSIYFVWCKDRERIRGFLERNDNSGKKIDTISRSTDGMVDVIEYDGLKKVVICLMAEYTGTPEQIAIIAHECLHAAITIFKIKMIPLPENTHYTENDEENLCHHMQWIMGELFARLQDQDKHKFSFHEETLCQTPTKKKRKSTKRSTTIPIHRG